MKRSRVAVMLAVLTLAVIAGLVIGEEHQTPDPAPCGFWDELFGRCNGDGSSPLCPPREQGCFTGGEPGVMTCTGYLTASGTCYYNSCDPCSPG